MNVFISVVFCIEIPISSVYSDQMLHFAASELYLHCLHIFPKLISGLKMVNTFRLNLKRMLMFISNNLQTVETRALDKRRI